MYRVGTMLKANVKRRTPSCATILVGPWSEKRCTPPTRRDSLYQRTSHLHTDRLSCYLDYTHKIISKAYIYSSQLYYNILFITRALKSMIKLLVWIKINNKTNSCLAPAVQVTTLVHLRLVNTESSMWTRAKMFHL